MFAKSSITGKFIMAVAVMAAAVAFGSACEEKAPPPPPPVVAKPTPPPVKPTPVATAEAVIATKEAAPKKKMYRIYEDEKQVDKFVELTEFSTGCTEMGDVFANGELVINPKLTGTQTIPLDRVLSITFGNFGLIDPDVIKGVGAITQPAGYRENEIALRNPDEKITGIVVICRQLKGVKADGTPWSIELLHDVAKKFHKIEIVEVE